ncbi:hypothetical protein K474DRAFT_1033519 [Panus rudis PR-1116 ss-1]|nr:hypothetical protein K474DRAFT_1033519 [Panus rudis PR-1116 ss-1]
MKNINSKASTYKWLREVQCHSTPDICDHLCHDTSRPLPMIVRRVNVGSMARVWRIDQYSRFRIRLNLVKLEWSTRGLSILSIFAGLRQRSKHGVNYGISASRLLRRFVPSHPTNKTNTTEKWRYSLRLMYIPHFNQPPSSRHHDPKFRL